MVQSRCLPQQCDVSSSCHLGFSFIWDRCSQRSPQASGVSVKDECVTVFEDVKKNKSYRFIIFKIIDEKVIDIEKLGDRDASYDDYLAHLTSLGENECRYGCFDFEYVHQPEGTTDSIPKQKLILMTWCPDTAKIKKNVVLI